MPVSERFVGLYQEIITQHPITIEFKDLATHPKVSFRQGTGFSNDQAGLLTVWLSTNQTAERLEITAAHECLHYVLGYEGYPITLRNPAAGDDEVLELVGGHLHCSLVDLEIDRRLRDRGFPILQKRLADLERMMKELQTQSPPPSDSPRGCLWVVRYVSVGMSSHYGVPRQARRRFLKEFESRFSTMAPLAQQLLNKVSAVGIATSEQMVGGVRVLRDGLRLQGKLAVMNQRTRQVW